MSAILEADGLCKRYGALKAVDDVSFTVGAGEVLGFLGPNGAGKTTTMKLLSGFLTPDAGAARIGGFDVRTHGLEAQAMLGYLPEGAPLYEEMTVAEFLRFIAEIRGVADAAAVIGAAAASLHLDSVLHQTIGTLSKGYRRRTGLAAAILHKPRVLILDEPTDGLDPNQKHEVRNLIRALAAGTAIIVSTHILEEVDAVCTRALILDHGRIVAAGTPKDLKAQGPDGTLDGLFRTLTRKDAA